MRTVHELGYFVDFKVSLNNFRCLKTNLINPTQQKLLIILRKNGGDEKHVGDSEKILNFNF